MTEKINRCYFETLNVGNNNPLKYVSSKSGFLSPVDAGAIDGSEYSYIAENGSPPTEWEIGVGVWNETAEELSRTSIISSSNSGNVVNFSAAPNVRMGVILSSDFSNEFGTSPKFDLISTINGVFDSISFDFNRTLYDYVIISGSDMQWELQTPYDVGDSGSGISFNVYDTADNYLSGDVSIIPIVKLYEWGDGYALEWLVNFRLILSTSPGALILQTSGDMKLVSVDRYFENDAIYHDTEVWSDLGDQFLRAYDSSTEFPSEVRIKLETTQYDSSTTLSVPGPITTSGQVKIWGHLKGQP